VPRYLYECKECSKHFDLRHPITEKYEVCSQISDCEEKGVLIRIPSFSHVIKKASASSGEKVGELTKDFIEQARQEMKEEKRSLTKQEYND